MYMNYAEIGSRLAEKRKKLMLTQVEVEEKAGLSRRYLSNIERGRSIPSIDVLMQVADILHMTPDEVLIGAVPERRRGRTAAEKAARLLRRMAPEQQEQALNFIQWLEEQKKQGGRT